MPPTRRSSTLRSFFVRLTSSGASLRYLALLLAFLIPFLVALSSLATVAFEIDACALVLRVLDGDTVHVDPHGRVRLADIDAPELGTREGELSRKALAELLEAYGPLILLDVDDVRTTDRYGRVVAVVYVRYNESHVLNVNAWLLANGYAVVYDHPNEFDPGSWSLFHYLPGNACASNARGPYVGTWPIIAALLAAGASLLVYLLAKGGFRRARRKPVAEAERRSSRR